MKPIIQLVLSLHAAGTASCLSAPTSKAAAPWQGLLDSLLPRGNAGGGVGTAARRSELKSRLSAECRREFGRNSPEIRRRIESVIEDLAPLNPTPRTASSPLLERRWALEWTSEREINFFLESGISEEISQTLGGGVLENFIPFVRGGGFGVTGTTIEDGEGSARTRFKFKNAKLDLGKWGVYNLPPVGEGWFDTIYLDEGLRIDTNSRNDILICRPDNGQ